MQQIKKRQQKRIEHRLEKQNKKKQQMQGIIKTSNVQSRPNQDIILQRKISQSKQQKNQLARSREDSEPNSFSIKNLDIGQYEAIDQNQFIKVQQQLNNRYEKIHSIDSLREVIWSQYKTNLSKAEEKFFEACAQGDLVFLDKVLQGKSEYPVNINSESEEGRNCLHVAINCCQNLDVIRKLVYKGANINHKSQLMRTPLILSVIKGLFAVTKFLIDFKCQLDIQDKYGNTALHYATMYSHYQIAELLLINNADTTLLNNENQTAYQCCANIKLTLIFDKQTNLIPRTVSSDYSRTVYEDKILKNGRIDHVQKLLSLASVRTNTIIQEPSENLEREVLNGSVLRRKKMLKRYQVMSQIKINDNKQVNLVDFKQVDILGKGAFGSVLLVEHVTTKKKYAMKILNKNQILQQKLLRYVLTENKIMRTINHPFIVKLHYAFQTAEKLILIMDYCPGGDLLEMVRRNKSLEQKIILALQCLHKAEIIYRDLKPANIVLDQDGHACLTDFGLSKEADISHSFCGSIAYLSPQMLSRRGHTRTIDWYLLGVLIYECYTGRPPFWDINKQQLLQNIKIGRFKPLPSTASEQLKDIVAKLLKSNPSKRLGNENDADQVKAHPWFREIDWNSVFNRKLQMPEITNIRQNHTQERTLRMEIFTAHEVQLGRNLNRIQNWEFKQ